MTEPTGEQGSTPAAPESHRKHSHHHHAAPRGKAFALLSLGALGVVYGDLGTSPLYALRECFAGHHPLPLNETNVLGLLSIVFWSLVLVVSVKYLAFVLRADNDGEGGILALMALVERVVSRKGNIAFMVLVMGVFGAALLYGDGILTPAISVLSAAEGLAIYAPAFHDAVVPLTLVILALLFLMQRWGTGGIGAIFGPVMLLWFVTIGVLGLVSLLKTPRVLAAMSPHHAVTFFIENGRHGFLALGAAFLALTGAEALYADMGHFGRKPIRFTWAAVVFPGLILCYFGQGALLLRDAEAIANPFYRLAPAWGLLPLVVLATTAACIASQAVISGTFSLTSQAVQLGLCPRLEIVHTSSTQVGQIYVPVVNWLLMAAVMLLVLSFKTSTSLAGAYGIAVASTMVITTVLAFFVARDIWKWSPIVLTISAVLFLTVDLAYLGSNLTKIADGGWLPLVLAGGVMLLLTTWRRGRQLLAERHKEGVLQLTDFLASIDSSERPMRVPGTGVFMTGNSEGVPAVMLHNLKHNKILHECNVMLTIESPVVPYIHGERITVEDCGQGFYRVVARYGFMEPPKFVSLIQAVRAKGLAMPVNDTSYFLGRESLIVTGRKGMSRWRKALFAWMARNARTMTAFFHLPPNRVVELGTQVEL